MSGTESIDLDTILEKDGLASEISNLYVAQRLARAEAEGRWSEATQYVYATSTVETSNNTNGWSHSTVIPKITQIYDNLNAQYYAALFPNPNWLHFDAFDRESAVLEKVENVKSYLKTKHKVRGFEREIQKILSDYVLYGNAFAAVTYVNETHTDPDTGDSVNGYSGPEVVRISPYDIVFNPLASSFEKSPKVVRSITSTGELIRKIEENPEYQHFSSVIPKLVGLRQNSGKINLSDDDKKNLQLQFDGYGSFTQYLQSGYVEILDFYGDIYDIEKGQLLKNHVITVVDRTWVVRSSEINTWTGHPHIYHVGWRDRPDNLWAMGPLDNLIGMQYYINHLENARADGFDQMLEPTRVIIGDVDEEDVEAGKPGGKYYVSDGGNVYNLSPDPTVLQADIQIQIKEAQMEAYAGSPREAMGLRTPGEKTKFEVQTLMNSAARIFESKTQKFEEEFLNKVVNAEIEVARRNLNYTDIIEVVDDDTGTKSFLTISKDDILANGVLVAQGARHYVTQQKLAQDLQVLTQTIFANPAVALHISGRQLAKLSIESILNIPQAMSLYEPFIQISEQLEAQRFSSLAEQQLQEEMMVLEQEDEDENTF